MPVLVERIRGNASCAPTIVIRCVGSDGMETNRELLSLVEAERHVASLRRAITLSRADTAIADYVIGINWPHPDHGCGVCGDKDHCLPRWEDDGGGLGPLDAGRPPSPARDLDT